MALIIEDGTGVVNANSYESVVNADTYNIDHAVDADWTLATTADKEKALRLATQYLDARFARRLQGSKIAFDQSLEWPRYDILDYSDYVLASDEIPRKWKNACCELALLVVQGEALFATEDMTSGISAESVSVGSISSSIQYAGAAHAQKRFPLIEALVAEFLSQSNRIERA